MNGNNLLEKLESFYSEKGIVNGSNFNCKNNETCCGFGVDLAQGMQCHVGTKFGEKERILVVSLDCGGAGAQNLVERTNTIEGLMYTTIINPHMRGTIKCISDFYQMDVSKKEALKYYAMTNSCKCTRNSQSMDKLDWRYYEKCADLKKDEIRIIDPDVIYFQGNDALIGCVFEDIPSVSENIKEFLKYLVIDGKKFIAVKCIHPSARGRHAKRKKEFYENTICEINEHIRTILLPSLCVSTD